MSNQKINSEILPSNLKNINWNYDCVPIEHHIEMVNNIPNYYNLKIFSESDKFSNNVSKWPIHAINYIGSK